MSAILNIPLDVESTPEFRQLVHLLKSFEPSMPITRLGEDESRAMASHLFLRLFVELGFHAASTNRPGLLPSHSLQLFYHSIGLAPALARVPSALKESRLVTESPEGLFCDLFARLNSHLAGNHVTKEQKGASRSAIERGKNAVAHEAAQQCMLLPSELFRDATGQPLEEIQRQRTMVVITTVDRVLGRKARNNAEVTPGLIADAHALVVAQDQETLKTFYAWLHANRSNHAVPKVTEQILKDPSPYVALALKE